MTRTGKRAAERPDPDGGARAPSRRSLSDRQKLGIVALVLVVGSVGGIEIARALRGYIEYWDVVSGPLWLTVRIGAIATLIAGVLGIASGYVLAKHPFPGRDVLETVGSLPIILPPTVMGFYALELLSPANRIGGFLTRLSGHELVYNVTGCVVVATVAAFPFCMRAARASIEGVDVRYEQAARAMGLPNWRVALLVTLPLARRGIAAGLTIGCARALGEYGATYIIGGDLNGKTRTLALAVIDSYTTPERNAMLLILVLMAVVAMTGVGLLGRQRT